MEINGCDLVGKIRVVGRPQARRRSRRHGRSPCVSTQSKRPAAVGLRFAEICGVVYRRLLWGGRDIACNHLWWGKIFRKLGLHGYRRSVIWSVIAYRRGEFYIGLQFVRLAAVAFLLLV